MGANYSFFRPHQPVQVIYNDPQTATSSPLFLHFPPSPFSFLLPGRAPPFFFTLFFFTFPLLLLALLAEQSSPFFFLQKHPSDPGAVRFQAKASEFSPEEGNLECYNF